MPHIDGVYRDWAVTILFYSALHYVDAYLTAHGDKPLTHKGRERAIENCEDLKAILKDYMALCQQSMRARYDIGEAGPEHVHHMMNALERIRLHVRGLLRIKD